MTKTKERWRETNKSETPFKPDFPGQTRAQYDIGRAERAEHDEMRRYSCNLLGFWRVCDDGRCRRAHACCGDQHRCFRIFWPKVNPEVKVVLRTAIHAAAANLSKAETEAKMFATLAWHRQCEDEAARERDGAAAPAQEVAPTAPRFADVTRVAAASPRVRTLWR